MGNNAPRPLTLAEVQKYLRGKREFIGPLPAVDDFRFVAGMLFARFNDMTTRLLINFPPEWPHVEVVWHGERSIHGYAKCFITPAALEKLRDERLVEETGEWGEYKMRLSQHGKRLVVTEWFAEDAGLHDVLKAGATIDLAAASLVWP